MLWLGLVQSAYLCLKGCSIVSESQTLLKKSASGYVLIKQTLSHHTLAQQSAHPRDNASSKHCLLELSFNCISWEIEGNRKCKLENLFRDICH